MVLDLAESRDMFRSEPSIEPTSEAAELGAGDLGESRAVDRVNSRGDVSVRML